MLRFYKISSFLVFFVYFSIIRLFIFLFSMTEPIPSLLRPQTLDDVVGQSQLIWVGKPLRTFIEHWSVPSMLFWWPPWCGKTTLAHVISQTIQADFFRLSWVTSKKDDLKEIIEHADKNHAYGKQTIVFLDEIHRWNKAQQDTLLPYVEKWVITLIWATTENPSFTVNNALLSRCRVFVFEKLTEDDIVLFVKKNKEKILSAYPEIILEDPQLLLIAKMGNGDLRNSLNVLESALLLKKTGTLTDQDILDAWQKAVYYDRNGEEHYTIISAVHKSLRDWDGDAACYWVQRMLMWWEDPLYIARRLLRFASEDIWPANNNALLLANQTYDAIAKIGMPECDVFLFHLVLYLAQSPKNNIAYVVAQETRRDVEKYWTLPVPMHLRNASSKLMKEIWYGEGYKYVHDDPSAKQQQHFPDELKGRTYST